MTFNEAMTGDFRFTEKYVQKINQVNCEDVLRVANKYLDSNKLSIVALIPRDETRKVGPFKESNIPLKIGFENLTKDSEEALPVKRHVLSNGLTLLIKENKDLPLVSIKAVFKGGLRAEDESSNGICNLVAAMLDQGTKSEDSSKIAYLIESKGARLSYFSGNNSFGLSLDLLSKDFEQMLELLSNLIMNSTFPEKEFKRLKEKSLAQLKAQEDDIFESGIRMLKSILFQKHPYRFLTLGNEKSLKKLRRRDLIDFYRDFCVGRNLVLAVFGDVDAEEVLVKTEKAFAKLNSGGLLRISPTEEPKIKTVQTSSKSLPKEQSLLLMGFHGTTVYSQNRYALEMICHILSRSSGKLFTEIRQKAGHAYSLGAYSVLGLDPGYIVVYVATTQENVEAVKNEILRQLRLLKERLLSEEELVQAKRALISKKLISRQTNSTCALESSLDELYELGSNYYLQYTDQINQIEAEDIIRCAKQYFDLTNYTTVVVGPKN
jgi:zinc protease